VDELARKIAERTGLDVATVTEALGVVLRFVASEAPAAQVEPLLERVAGARELIAGGKAPGGIFGVLNALSGAGLGYGDLKPFVDAFLSEGRQMIGTAEVDALIASIPALRQFTAG
jgi:hypothetical protein